MLKNSSFKRAFLAAILGAVLLFIWSYVTWMLIPWHQGEISLYNTITVETATTSPMWIGLVLQFIVQYVSAFLVAILLFNTELKGYWCRVGFVLVFGLAAGIFCYVPQWIWFKIPLNFTAVNVLDAVIGWFFAGLGLSLLAKKS